MTFFRSDQIDWKSKVSKRGSILLFAIFFMLAGYAIYKEEKTKHELSSVKFTWAVVTGESSSGRSRHYYHVKYFAGGKKMISSKILIRECSHKKNIGDTIIINYSTINVQTVSIRECYWNDNLKKEYGYYEW